MVAPKRALPHRTISGGVCLALTLALQPALPIASASPDSELPASVAPASAIPATATQPPAAVPHGVVDGDVAKRIVELTAAYANPNPPGPAATYEDLKAAAATSRQVSALLVDAGDVRGIFGVGLDEVEARAVVPFEENSSQWARALSTNLIYRYLSAVHAEFSGQQVPEHWKRYFDAAKSAEFAPEQVAMFGYNAHLTVDLALAVADSGATAVNWPEYLTIVGLIADCAQDIIVATRYTYGADLMPIWEAVAITPPTEQARGQVVRLGDQSYSSISFANGLGIANPETTVAAKTTVEQMWSAVDVAVATYR